MSSPSTVSTINEEMQTKDELSALVATQILKLRFNIEVSPKNTVWRMQQKLGWRTGAVQTTANQPK